MGFSSVVWGYVLPLVVLLAALFGAKILGVEDGPAALTSIVAVAFYYVAIYLMHNMFDKKIHFTIIKE